MGKRQEYLYHRYIVATRELVSLCLQLKLRETLNWDYLFGICSRIDVTNSLIINGSVLMSLDDLENRLVELENIILWLSRGERFP